MNQQIILPKKRKLDEVEEVPLPTVKCDFCGNHTTQGLKQEQWIPVKPGGVRIMPDGSKKLFPASMKKVEYFMCNDCVKKGAKWPKQPKRWK